MSGFIDDLEDWFNSMSDKELAKSWEESTKGMEMEDILDVKNFSEDEASALEALTRLRFFRNVRINAWNKDKKEKWQPNKDNDYYSILNIDHQFVVTNCKEYLCMLSFPTKEMAEEFLNTFHEDIVKLEPLFN